MLNTCAKRVEGEHLENMFSPKRVPKMVKHVT